MMSTLTSAFVRTLAATEALANLLDLPMWDGEQSIPEWCAQCDLAVRSPWSRARRSMLADLVTWEHDENVSPTLMALTAIVRNVGHGDPHAETPAWSAAAHVVSPTGAFGLGSHRAVAKALVTWQAAEKWRDSAKPADLGIPVQIGSQFKQRPEVVVYQPLDEQGLPMVGTFEPCPDDYVREAVSEARVARVTRPNAMAKKVEPGANVTDDDGKIIARKVVKQYVRHGDGAYSTIGTDGTVTRHNSRKDYLAGRARQRTSAVTARLSALRSEQTAARAAWATLCAELVKRARDGRVIGPVVHAGAVVAYVKPGTRSAHVYSADGRRLPATRDIEQHARALAASLV